MESASGAATAAAAKKTRARDLREVMLLLGYDRCGK
jgi:hypothetical protein